jgi:hypothetical protein
VEVVAVQVVRHSQITKQLVAKEAVPQGKQGPDHHLLKSVEAAAVKLLGAMVDLHGALVNSEQQV